MGLFIKNKRRGRGLGKPRRGLQIMDTRIGFPCPFHSVVIDSIGLRDRDGGRSGRDSQSTENFYTFIKLLSKRGGFTICRPYQNGRSWFLRTF